MTVLSIRFKRPGALERLKRLAAGRSESISALGERLIDEGLRMEAHPGIVFRDGPSGRRAGLARGPDVNEVISLLRDLRGGLDKRIAQTAEQMSLANAQVRSASSYYTEFTAEIDAEIDANLEATDREFAAWEAQRQLFAE